MHERDWPVGLVAIGLLLASMTLAACTGAAAPATGSGGTQTEAASLGIRADEGGGAVTLPDPCTLLTQAEIEAQFTFEVAPGIGSSAPGSGATSPDCNWNPVDYHSSFTGVSLVVQKLDQGFFDFMKGPNSKDVAGLGDAAYFDQPTNPITLWMKRGDLLFAITVIAQEASPDVLHPKVINLANNVLAHL